MAENTSLEWRFTPNGGSSTDRPTSGEIKFLNPTLSGNSGEDAFDYVNTVELQYPTQLSGIPLARHEGIEITITNHNIAPQVNTEPRTSSTRPEYIEYYRVDFFKAGINLVEYDIFNSDQLRASGWKQKWYIFQNDMPSYIGIELLRFRDDNALLNNNYEVISNFIIEFTVKEPVTGTDVLVSTPASTIQSDLDSNIATLAVNQALIDSAIAVGAGGIHGGLNLDSVQNIGLGPSLIKDSDGKFISPKVSGINVDSAQIDNLTFDSSSGNTLVISDSANISNLNTDSAHIKTLSGNSLNFDSGTFDKIKLGATSGITLGDSTESDGTGTLDNYTKLLGTRISTPSLVSNKIEVDSANIGSELRVGRYRIEAGDSDDESVLLTDDYGGIHYYRNKGKYASLKFNERDDKWHFYPKIRVTDLDSDGLDEVDEDGITNTIRKLGAGGHGEILSFNSILNAYEWDYIVRSGKFVNTDSDLTAALAIIPSPVGNTTAQNETKDLLHSTWKSINHGNIPNVTKTPLRYPYDQSMMNYVYYDTDSHTIKTLTTDHVSNSITGFVSDKSYPDYEATIKFTGDSSNMSMGFIIAYVNEGEVSPKNGIDVFAKQSTLTVFRTPNPAGYDGSDVSISNNTNFYTSYALVYNAFQPDQLILDNDGTSELGGTTHSTWSDAGVTAITVKKDLNYLRISLSDFGDSIPDVNKILEFNLDENFNGLLRKFSGQVSYGVATSGVKGGKFDITFDDGAITNINTKDQIIDLKNDQVYVYVDSDASQFHNWPIGYKLIDSDDQGNPIDYFKEEFSLGRIYHNPESEPPRTFYKDPYVSFQLASIFENIIEDKTPQLGGNLDLNGFDINNVTGPIIIDPSPVNDSAGLVRIKGNLEVDGTTTTINSTELTIVDKNIEIAKGAANAAAADGGGITIDGANATILYNADSDVFALNKVFANPNAGATNLISSYNTDQLGEGSNLYFTQSRARASISGTDGGGDGSFSYDNATGIITYTGPSASETRAHFSAANTGTADYAQLAYSAGIYTLNVDPLIAAEIPSLDAAKITSGAFDDDRIAETSITQHEAAIAVAGSQLTGTIPDARITEASITQHEAAIAVAGSQLTGTIPVARMADSAVLLDSTGVIPTTSISSTSVSQHAAAITTAQDTANAFPNLTASRSVGSTQGTIIYTASSGTLDVSFPKNYGRFLITDTVNSVSQLLNPTISGADLNDRFEFKAGSGIALAAPAAGGWEADYMTISAAGGAAGLSGSTITITGTPAAGTTLVADGSGGFSNGAISYTSLDSVPSTFPPTLGTSSTTALAGDTALLAIGTSNTTALAGNTALFDGAFASLSSKPTTLSGYGITDGGGDVTASSTDNFTNKSGNNSQWTNDEGYTTLAIGTSSTTALAGNTALLAIGTTSSTAMAGNSALTTINANADDRVITGSGTANTLNGEANMTFDGSTLAVTGLAVTGAITATGNITAAFSSDSRLKENLEKIENSLDKVEKINGYTFNWNDKSDQNTEVRDVGVIAQEVEEILPEVVIDRVDGYKAVYYEKLIPLLIESIKELKTRIEVLENKE